MAQELYFDIRIPENGDEFEHLTRVVCAYKFGSTFSPYGRKGQRQYGIDLYSNNFQICVQCKNYQGYNAVNRLLDSIKHDFSCAVDKFKNCMGTYVLATTVQRDTSVQDLFAQISRDYPEIDIQLLFWEDFQEVLRENPELIKEVKQASDTDHKLQNLVECLPNSLENLDGTWFASQDKTSPIKWGYASIDNLYKISPGSIVLLSGYFDVDTSILAQNIARFNGKQNRRIIYFNLKESTNLIMEKFIAAEGFVDIEAIRAGRLREDDWQRVVAATTVLANNILFSPYDITRSMSELFLSTVQFGNADLVVLDDFAGLCLDATQMSAFLYRLRSIATESNTTVLMVIDIPTKPSRTDERPILSDPPIREISKFCDVIQFLYHDEYSLYSHNSTSKELELITAKYYSSLASTTVFLMEVPRFACMVEYEKNSDSSQDLSEKYPRLVAGATLLSKIFDQL